MSAFDDAMARLDAGYYNPNPQTEANPGGMGGYGYLTSLFAMLQDLVAVGMSIGGAATLIRDAAPAAGAARAASDDALAYYNATKAKADFFNPVSLAELRAGTNNTKFLSALGLFSFGVSTVLPWAATMAPSRHDGVSRHLTMTGHATLANPTDFVAGQSGRFRFTMGGAGGYTLSYGLAYRFPLGIKSISGGVGSIDTMSYYVHAANDLECYLGRGLA